jgi:hypothetical protein
MHPTNRAERRHQRERVIAARRFVHNKIWRRDNEQNGTNPFYYSYRPDWAFTEWGRYAKWNLGCGCMGCHREKYYDQKSMRRKARKAAMSPVECRVGDRIVNRLSRTVVELEDDEIYFLQISRL